MARVLPNALFDYFLAELPTHPDLRPLDALWQAWQRDAAELATDAKEARLLTSVMKTVLLFKIAGLAPTVVQIANATGLDAGLPGEGNYEYTQVLLERISLQLGHLAVERNEGPFQDRYTVDSGTRVSELARRHLKNALAELRADDARLAAHVLRACSSEPLPLASFGSAQSVSVFWRNSPRALAVKVLDGVDSVENIANLAAMLAQPGNSEDLLLLIAPPFAVRSWNTEYFQRLPQVVLWQPRAPADDEVQLAREATAAHLLQDDPLLLDNRRGRAILNHVKESAAARDAQLMRVARRLLREGQVQSGERIIEANELATGDIWQSELEAIAAFALPQIFPKFEAVAPRARVLTPSNADQLCLEILRRPADEPYYSAAVERLVRALAEPLGVARPDKGRWKIAPLNPALQEEAEELAREGSSRAALESKLAKSQWGLRPEQVALAVCALLRSGELTALDAKSRVLSPAQISMPLRRAVHALQLGRRVEPTVWERVQKLASLVTTEKLPAHSLAAQTQARRVLQGWRDELHPATELAQVRVRQLQRALGHSPTQWPRTESTLQSLAGVLQKLADDGDITAFLHNAASINIDELRPHLKYWNTLQGQLDARHALLLRAHHLLTQPSLSTPRELQEQRLQLLQILSQGEEVLLAVEVVERAAAWQAEYSRLYQDWHHTQHNPARWNSLRRLLNSDELRALERLSTLASRSFPQGTAIRQELQQEQQKHCARDGVLLPGDAICNACSLRFGERVVLRDEGKFAAEVHTGLQAFRKSLQVEPAISYLQRSDACTSMLEWDGDGTALWGILSDEVLAALDDAFKPRRRVSRSSQKLLQSLATCRTKQELEAAFAQWLDAGEALSGDDEVALE